MKWKSLLSLPFVAGLTLGVVSTGLAATTLGSSIFRDISRNAYYDSAVGEMYSLGIIKGYPDGRFGPGDYVTRADIAVMLQRLRNELKGIPQSSASSANSSSSVESSSSVSSSSVSSSSSSRSSSSRSSSSSSSSVSSYPQAGGFEFGVPSTSIPESVKSLTLSIKRIGGTKGDVTVKYTATGSTATAGQDFTAANGTVSFQDGETSKNITITLKEDTAAEGPESLRVVLSSPTGGAILGNNSTMVITILDNEAANNSSSSTNSSNSSTASVNTAGSFVFSASVYSVEENVGTVTITVNRNGGTNGAVNVNYATNKGSASNSTEYTDTSGTLNFAAGEASKTITVQLKDDSNIDGDRNFSIALSSPTGGASLGNPATATVVLVDNENMTTGSGSFKFSASQYKVVEGNQAVITIQRVGGTKGTATVQWNIGAGSALPGPDFTQTTGGTLTFAPGEGSKVVLINTFDDGKVESEESAYLNLSNATGAPLGTLTSATLLISD